MIKLLLCVSLVITVVFATFMEDRNISHNKSISRMMPMPEFKHCTCDSATYCLNDGDVIRLHIWYDSIKYSLGEK